MDDDQFWQLIEAARTTAGGDPDAMADALSAALNRMSRAQVEQFEQAFVRQSRRTYTWNHGDAAELVCGYLGDDGYTDFRSWMIAQGRRVYEAFVADPDSLADLDHVEDACEGAELFGAAASDVYESKGGVPGDDVEAFPIPELAEPPAGEKLPTSEIRASFPKLAARFPA